MFIQIVQYIFNRLEPRSPLTILSLLCGVPGLLILALLPSFGSLVRAVLYVHAVFFATILLSILLYRGSPFHRLAGYPGPFVNRFSGLVMAKVATGGKRHLYLKKVHEKYGPFVRIGIYLNLTSVPESSSS